jgi:hypothetical protein
MDQTKSVAPIGEALSGFPTERPEATLNAHTWFRYIRRKVLSPVLRHGTIIFTRTLGRCDQHDMGEGILG